MAGNVSIMFEAVLDESGVISGLKRIEGEAGKAATSIEQKFAKAGKGIGDFGKSFSMKVGLPIGAAMTASGLAFGEFDAALRRIQGLVGVAASEIDSYRGTITRLSSETARSGTELADAMFFITSAGLRGDKALSVLDMSAKAAAAGLGDMKIVADAVTSAMNAYALSNMTAEHATDILVATVREGKMAPEELAGSLGRVLPLASQIGVTFDEIGASIASMTRIGLDSSEAVTALRGALAVLAGKAGRQAEEALSKVGMSLSDLQATLKNKGLLAALQQVVKSFEGQDNAIMQVFGSIRAYTGLMALAGKSSQAVEGIFGRMIGTQGDMNKAWDIASKGPLLEFHRQTIKIKQAMKDLGEVTLPVITDKLRGVADAVKEVVNAFRSLDPSTQKLIAQFAAFLVILGPLAIGVSMLVKGVGLLIPLYAQLIVAIKTANTASVLSGVGFSGVGAAALAAKASLVLLVGYLSYEVTTALLKVTGLQAAWNELLARAPSLAQQNVEAFKRLQAEAQKYQDAQAGKAGGARSPLAGLFGVAGADAQQKAALKASEVAMQEYVTRMTTIVTKIRKAGIEGVPQTVAEMMKLAQQDAYKFLQIEQQVSDEYKKFQERGFAGPPKPDAQAVADAAVATFRLTMEGIEAEMARLSDIIESPLTPKVELGPALLKMKELADQAKEVAKTSGDPEAVKKVVEAQRALAKAIENVSRRQQDEIKLEMEAQERRIENAVLGRKEAETQIQEYDRMAAQIVELTRAREGEIAAQRMQWELDDKRKQLWDKMREGLTLPKAQPLPWDIVLNRSQVQPEVSKLAAWAKETLSKSVADGIIEGLKSGKITDAFKLIADAFGGFAAGALGNAMTALMEPDAKKRQTMLQESGWMVEKTLADGTKKLAFNWMQAAATLGGILGQIGQAKQNRGLTTAAGAISGGVGGGMVGGAIAGSMGGWNWVGAIVGAVVGGLMAYFGSAGPGKETATGGLKGGRGYITEITGGVGKEAERVVAETITARYRTVSFAFRESLHLLGQAIGDMPNITLALNERSKNLQSAIDAFIKSTVPKAVFEFYKPALVAGLTAVGVSAGRIEEQMRSFVTGDFDKALAAFARYVSALVNMQELTKELGKDLDTLRADVTLTVRDTFLKSMTDTLKGIADLSEGMDQMTSEEQVVRAEQIGALATEQYNRSLEYLKNLVDVQKEIKRSFDDIFLGFEEDAAKAKGKGSEAAFYTTQITKLMEQLRNAKTPEVVRELVAKIQQFGQALYQLGSGADQAGFSLTSLLMDMKMGLSGQMAKIEGREPGTEQQEWWRASQRTLWSVKELADGIEGLANDEQVSRLQQIGQLAASQYEANLNYLRRISDVQKSVAASFEETFAGFEEARAKEKGPQWEAYWLTQQMVSLREQLAQARTPEEVEQLTRQMLEYGKQLWALGESGSYGGFDTKAWAEQFLKEAQAAAETALKGMQDEVLAQQALLVDVLTGLQGMLTGLEGFDWASWAEAQLKLASQIADTLLASFQEEVKAQMDLLKAAIDGTIVSLQSVTIETEAVQKSLKDLGDELDDTTGAVGRFRDALDKETGDKGGKRGPENAPTLPSNVLAFPTFDTTAVTAATTAIAASITNAGVQVQTFTSTLASFTPPAPVLPVVPTADLQAALAAYAAALLQAQVGLQSLGEPLVSLVDLLKLKAEELSALSLAPEEILAALKEREAALGATPLVPADLQAAAKAYQDALLEAGVQLQASVASLSVLALTLAELQVKFAAIQPQPVDLSGIGLGLSDTLAALMDSLREKKLALEGLTVPTEGLKIGVDAFVAALSQPQVAMQEMAAAVTLLIAAFQQKVIELTAVVIPLASLQIAVDGVTASLAAMLLQLPTMPPIVPPPAETTPVGAPTSPADLITAAMAAPLLALQAATGSYAVTLQTRQLELEAMVVPPQTGVLQASLDALVAMIDAEAEARRRATNAAYEETAARTQAAQSADELASSAYGAASALRSIAPSTPSTSTYRRSA
jgi:TP901 family phage tail tape measure protein